MATALPIIADAFDIIKWMLTCWIVFNFVYYEIDNEINFFIIHSFRGQNMSDPIYCDRLKYD